MFVLRNNGRLSFCVDYSWLNSVVLRGSFPISPIDECFDSLGEAQIFSTLNVDLGYSKIEMDYKDVNKTVLVTYHGLFKYSQMTSELKNAPSMFQQAMDVILVSIKWQHAIVYIDDNLIFLKR